MRITSYKSRLLLMYWCTPHYKSYTLNALPHVVYLRFPHCQFSTLLRSVMCIVPDAEQPPSSTIPDSDEPPPPSLPARPAKSAGLKGPGLGNRPPKMPPAEQESPDGRLTSMPDVPAPGFPAPANNRGNRNFVSGMHTL